jgi:glycosyltransferase involved in cell wall biosynthesis
MKLHVLANPRNPTGLMNRIDPFAVHAYKYIKHLSPHYEIIHYGVEGAQVDCEHIDVPGINGTDTTAFNTVAGEEIAKRKSPDDLIISFFGVDNKLACDMNPDCKVVEPSIGYRANGVFAPYRVFTSYANMHYFYGERGMLMTPSWFDAVISNPFTVSEFEYCDQKDDYYLYLGRVVEEKGVHLAIQATEKLGKKLIIAGPAQDLSHLGYKSIPSHVQLVGYVNAEQRNQLLKNAKALLGLTYYLEPFGNMVIEANLCGTPVITTDWGAFPEIVIEGVTGFRIRNFQSLLNAMNKVDLLDPFECYEHGLQFSDENVHELHHLYLQKVIKNSFYD